MDRFFKFNYIILVANNSLNVANIFNIKLSASLSYS